MAHDRLEGDDLPLTHDVIARMLGVRRASVTAALKPWSGPAPSRRGAASPLRPTATKRDDVEWRTGRAGAGPTSPGAFRQAAANPSRRSIASGESSQPERDRFPVSKTLCFNAHQTGTEACRN
jgi:hypothetical protein